MNAQTLDEAKLAELIYQAALEAGEVSKRDKAAVIYGALAAFKLPKEEVWIDDML